MAGRVNPVAIGLAATAALLLLTSAADAQMKKGSHAAPTGETKPWVDEKAYKSALDRIPTPKKPYDPWGQVHDDQTAKPAGKSN
jgi:hypothetical protein